MNAYVPSSPIPVTEAYLAILEHDLQEDEFSMEAADTIRVLISAIRTRDAALTYARDQVNILWDSGYSAAQTFTSGGSGPAPMWAQALRAGATGHVCNVINAILWGGRGPGGRR